MTIPRMKIKTPVPFPATVAGTGGIKVSKSGGVWTIKPDFSQLSTVLASAVSDPTTKEIWLWDPVTDDYNVLTLAGLGDALYRLTSTTSLAVGTGPKAFTTQSGKDVTVGSWVLATDDANPTVNWMLGQVTAYSGVTLSVNVTAMGGTGTCADWTLRFSGPPGQAKSAGLSYQWSANNAASDPGSGFVKANNATFALITSLFMSETDADGNAMAPELATWSNGTSSVKGRLKIYDPVTPTNFMTFDVTAVADSGAYDTLTVTPIAAGGSLTASLLVRAAFTAKGDLGNTGPQGINAGVNINFDTSVTMANPGTGNLRLNNATIGSATALAISASSADAGNPSISSLVNTWDDSSTLAHRGQLTIRKASAPTSVWATFDITGALTDNTTWLQLTVAYLSGPGGFSAADALVVSFARTGDAGAGSIAGATANGVGIATGASAMTSTAALTAGQVVIGQAAGAPTPQTVSGDVTITAAGVTTVGAAFVKNNATSTISKGFTITPNNIGAVSSGTVTPDPTLGNYQYYTNNGAHTIAAPSNDCAIDILVTNGASAGAITFSGFTAAVGNTGDALTTTNTNKFIISIRRINAVSTYIIKALQ